MSQTAYTNLPAQGFAGLRYDAGFGNVVSAIASSHQMNKVVVTTASNAEVFTVTINGTAYTYTSDASGTKPEITAGLKLAIDAGGEPVTVTDDTTDTLTIENDSIDVVYTISVTSPATGVLTLTELIPFEQAIAFGSVVVEDENADASIAGKRQGCRLPRLATDFSGRLLLGVALADPSMLTRSSAPIAGYSSGEAVPVLTRGKVWMTVEDPSTVAKGGLVYVRHIATGTEALGAIRAADDGADTEVLDAQQAQFTGQVDTTLGIAVVDWNLP